MRLAAGVEKPDAGSVTIVVDMRSGDFGLVPDQAYSQTNELKPDGSKAYSSAF